MEEGLAGRGGQSCFVQSHFIMHRIWFYFSISENLFLPAPFMLLSLLKCNTPSYCKISSEQVFYFRFSHRASGRPPQRLYAALTAADGFSKYSGKVAATDETALNEPSWLSHGLCGTSLSRNFCIDDGISRKSHPPSQGQRTIFCGVCLSAFHITVKIYLSYRFLSITNIALLSK